MESPSDESETALKGADAENVDDKILTTSVPVTPPPPSLAAIEASRGIVRPPSSELEGLLFWSDDEWFVQVGQFAKEAIGPYTKKQVLDALQKQEYTLETVISNDRAGPWVRLGDWVDFAQIPVTPIIPDSPFNSAQTVSPDSPVTDNPASTSDFLVTPESPLNPTALTSSISLTLAPLPDIEPDPEPFPALDPPPTSEPPPTIAPAMSSEFAAAEPTRTSTIIPARPRRKLSDFPETTAPARDASTAEFTLNPDIPAVPETGTLAETPEAEPISIPDPVMALEPALTLQSVPPPAPGPRQLRRKPRLTNPRNIATQPPAQDPQDTPASASELVLAPLELIESGSKKAS